IRFWCVPGVSTAVSVETMGNAQTLPDTIQRGKFQAAVVAARIIPLSEIVGLPGFTELAMDQMARFAHTPVNLQWLSRTVDWLKRGRSAALMPLVAAGWQSDQVRLENDVRATFHRIVGAVLDGDDAALAELDGPIPRTTSGMEELDELLADGR